MLIRYKASSEFYLMIFIIIKSVNLEWETVANIKLVIQIVIIIGIILRMNLIIVKELNILRENLAMRRNNIFKIRLVKDCFIDIVRRHLKFNSIFVNELLLGASFGKSTYCWFLVHYFLSMIPQLRLCLLEIFLVLHLVCYLT